MIAPPNFGYVEDGIYRCGSPDPRNYGFLASLSLKTCILLTDSHDEAFVRFLQECGVNILSPLSASSAVGAPPQQQPPRLGAEDARSGAVSGLQSPRRPPPSQPYSPQPRAQPGRSAERVDSAGGGYWPTGETDVADLAEADGDPLLMGNGSVASNSSGPSPLSEDGGALGSASGWPRVPPSTAAAKGSNMGRFLRRNAAGRGGNTLLTSVVAGGGGGGVDATGSLYLNDDSMVANSTGPSGAGPPTTLSRQLNYASGSEGTGNAMQKGLMTLSELVVVDILHVLLDPAYYPVLVTCPMGRYRTGIVCGCLRKLQRWNLVSILEEYRRFAEDKSRAENEDFIELFDKDLVSLELSGGRRPTVLYS